MLCVLGLCLMAHGQEHRPQVPDPLDEAWRIRVFQDLHGLGIIEIVEDPAGRLWFATNAGVSRYDGHAWESWSIAGAS